MIHSRNYESCLGNDWLCTALVVSTIALGCGTFQVPQDVVQVHRRLLPLVENESTAWRDGGGLDFVRVHTDQQIQCLYTVGSLCVLNKLG